MRSFPAHEKILPTGAIPSGIVRSGRAAELFIRYVPDADVQVVDVGCGNGAFIRQLCEHGYASVSGVEAVRYPASGDLPVVTADVSRDLLPWRDGSCGAVTAWEVLEHLENPRHLVREAHRVLAPGGCLFVSLPNALHLMSRLMFLRQGNLPRWTAANDHYNIFTRDVFRKIFLKEFALLEIAYHRPEIGKGFLHPITSRLTFLNRFLPENALWSHFIIYVLKKR